VAARLKHWSAGTPTPNSQTAKLNVASSVVIKLSLDEAAASEAIIDLRQ